MELPTLLPPTVSDYLAQNSNQLNDFMLVNESSAKLSVLSNILMYELILVFFNQ